MQTTKLIFNNKTYVFDSELLNKFFERMLYNEEKDEDEKKWVISFLSSSFCKKTYDELEYHEFVIEGNFRFSQLLCNIENIFGESIKKEYQQGLSHFFEEEVSETDWFSTLTASDALKIAKSIFINETDLSKFKELLSVIYLYECSQFDYEQTIENIDDFNNLEFINGIGVKLIIKDENILLKPIHSIYDVPIEKYIKISHVLVPPIVLTMIFRTVIEGYNESEVKFTVNNFFKKFEQLTGKTSIMRVPEPQKKFTGNINPQLIGKWYHIYKSNGFMPMYHINIEWFKEDGTQLRSVAFTMGLGEYKDYENWGPKESKWLTNETELYINDAYAREEKVYSYQLNERCLKYGNREYYKSYDEAAKNVENLD